MPVMKLLSFEARKRTALAISSGVPVRPNGVRGGGLRLELLELLVA